jgi:hypothetical protein
MLSAKKSRDNSAHFGSLAMPGAAAFEGATRAFVTSDDRRV